MILGILQARCSSTRLPGKVLKPILGRPMLEHQIERILCSKKIDDLIVATSEDSSDEPLVDLCNGIEVDVYRGSLEDVLDRFYQSVQMNEPEVIVRLTGDCPLTDYEVIDDTISFFLDNSYDYVSNCLQPTFPDGLDVEVFKYACLEKAWREAKLPSEREHVTPYLYSASNSFKIGVYKQSKDLSALRWTVDEPADFEFVKQVYERLYPENPNFLMGDILDLLEKDPSLNEINSKFERNEGLKKSQLKDLAVKKK